jgi:hypothetical protein
MNKFIDKILKEAVSETEQSFTMYSGVSLDQWKKIWKEKKLTDRLTNVTSDISFAADYSYDFQLGKYDDVVLEISNIPIEAFVGYRKNNYKGDTDFKNISQLSYHNKIIIINKYSLFLVDLFKFKNQISVKLIKV